MINYFDEMYDEVYDYTYTVFTEKKMDIRNHKK